MIKYDVQATLLSHDTHTCCNIEMANNVPRDVDKKEAQKKRDNVHMEVNEKRSKKEHEKLRRE